MLIKEMDDKRALLARVEERAQGYGAEAKRAEAELRKRRAGIRGESEAAYLIDFDYAPSPNWAVIHDLRIEHNGRTAQIDHLLINRWMEVYVLETKSFQSGLKITEEGEFLRWNGYLKTYEGMASPLEQNERHIQVLRDVMGEIEMPRRFGLRVQPAFQSYVLINPAARIDRPNKHFDASRVIKADVLKKTIWREIEGANPLLGLIKVAAKVVPCEAVEYVARELVARHRPLEAPVVADKPGETPQPTASQVVNPDPPKPAENDSSTKAPPSSAPKAPNSECSCKACGAGAGTIQYGKFGYYFKCAACGQNTSIRFTCLDGHSPRLRKAGNTFHRECAQCGTSAVYFINGNAAGDAA